MSFGICAIFSWIVFTASFCIFLYYLTSGSDIEAKDRDNFTPLLLAACYGHAKTVELLLQRGADSTVEDKNDKTAVFLAAEENKQEALEVCQIKIQNAKFYIFHEIRVWLFSFKCSTNKDIVFILFFLYWMEISNCDFVVLHTLELVTGRNQTCLKISCVVLKRSNEFNCLYILGVVNVSWHEKTH